MVRRAPVRALTLGHVAARLKAAEVDASDEQKKKDELPKLAAGYMHLHGVWKPSLQAETYEVHAVQTVQIVEGGEENLIQNYISTDTLKTEVPQTFTVAAPQFSLPANAVHSYYPPDGHQDEGRVLPHVVLDDPHLPWERLAGSTGNLNKGLTGYEDTNSPVDGKPLRLQVPWLAVLVFDPEELKLAEEDLSELPISPAADPSSMPQSLGLGQKTTPPSGAYPMTVAQYISHFTPPNRPNYEKMNDFRSSTKEYARLLKSEESTSVIFPARKLISDIFGPKGVNIEQHKHLAHVRRINTTGMPDVGVNEEGTFSVIVSHRTGPHTLAIPKPQIAHLVSIEYLDTTLQDSTFGSPEKEKSRFAMVSLFSWIYLATPPNPVSFVDSLIRLGEEEQMLRPSKVTLANDFKRKPNGDRETTRPIPDKLLKRLREGYTFVRWRTATGEPTVALNRSPLCPVSVKTPPSKVDNDWPGSSNYGTDYEILDKELGVMDITYAMAWHLGKTMAIADRNFAAALMRFRSVVHEAAASSSNSEVAGFRTAPDLVTSTPSAARRLLAEARSTTPIKFGIPDVKTPLPLRKDDAMIEIFQKHVTSVTRTLTGGSDGKLFNEFNLPANPDWAIISSWISDRLNLGGIPAHHLFVDPSHLPMESLRFFHIDPNWLDCLVDGALSTANHLDKEDDYTRRKIKECYNEYLETPIHDRNPQVPTFGFVIRSAVIKAFPDLRIEISYKNPDSAMADICRHTNIDATTMMCLLDRGPEQIQSIKFSQPPHQQRFSLGSELTSDYFGYETRTLYTQNLPAGPWPTVLGNRKHYYRPNVSPNPPDPDNVLNTDWYSWSTRCINLKSFTAALTPELKAQRTTDGKEVYTDDIITSVQLGLELNDPCYFLQLDTPSSANPAASVQRSLWTGKIKAKVPPPQKDPPVATGPPKPTDPRPPTAGPPATTGPLEPIPRMPSEPTNVKKVAVNDIGTPSPSSRDFPTGNLRSRYTVAIYPDFNLKFPKPRDANYTIPTKYPYLIDLIVSVRRNGVADPTIDYNLQEIVVNLPVAKAGQANEPLLDGYDGPGGRMLSNLRYNVMLNMSDTTLQCRVVPRGKPTINISSKKTDELSFKLSECFIGDVRVPRTVQSNDRDGPVVRGVGVVQCGWIESYKQGNATIFTTEQPCVVYKKDRDISKELGEEEGF